jgi:hypothetical protein
MSAPPDRRNALITEGGQRASPSAIASSTLRIAAWPIAA